MLLSVWNKLKPSGARLIVAGGHVRDNTIFPAFAGSYEEILRISLSELVALYQNADVFVLPSVAEGFGHVYLESLACSTP